ncbi:MAG: hypothetical protein ACFFD2_12490 [Promethearchaeota archaeon]
MLIYFKFYKKESIIQKEFQLSPYQRKINLDETSLIIIDDALTPELMVQFSYECLNGTNDSKTIFEAEEQHMEKILTESKIKDVLDKGDLFESK